MPTAVFAEFTFPIDYIANNNSLPNLNFSFPSKSSSELIASDLYTMYTRNSIFFIEIIIILNFKN
jgi:hypothetical protein